jgi:phosphoglycerate-specific signal transduction histidine kinase
MTERTLEKPLTPQEIDDLRQKLKDSNTLLAAIDKAVRAGIDVGNRRAEVLAAQAQIQKLINTYGSM